MVKLKAITGSSWLLMTDDEQERVGILSKDTNGFTFLAKEVKARFDTELEINSFFKEDIFDNLVESEAADDVEYFVKGYPVNFDKPYEIDPEDEITTLPLYAKTKNSEVYHCAGYYCIKFPKGWVLGYCPKYSTLHKYDFEGPYKTELDSKSTLSKLKKTEKAE